MGQARERVSVQGRGTQLFKGPERIDVGEGVMGEGPGYRRSYEGTAGPGLRWEHTMGKKMEKK